MSSELMKSISLSAPTSSESTSSYTCCQVHGGASTWSLR
jgi:hypothetical protein